MKLGFSVIALSFAVHGFAQGLTEDEAISIGIQNSFGVKAAASQLRQAKERTNQALGMLGFRLDGQATYERYEPSRLMGSGSGQSDSKTASLAFNYPIDLVGLRGKAIRGARSNESAAERGIDVEENNTKESIRRAYFNVLRAEWQVQVQTGAHEAAEARLKNAQTLYTQGAIARFDVLRYETEVSRAQSSLESANNQVLLAKQVLNQAMSRDVATPIELASPYADVRTDNLPRYTLNEGALLQQALENRPELTQLEALLKAREFFTVTERGGLLPSLNLQALYLHTFDAGAFSRENAVTFGITLSFPIWDSGITRARVAVAKEDEVQTRLAADRTRLSVSLEVQSALVQVRNSLSQLNFVRKTVELQSEALRLAELRYSAGEGILLDVTTADSDLRTALGALASARSDYLTAIASLKRAIGSDNLPPANP
ncbi:MAG: TolC family protein [Chthonomonas sp.]|nr:TolC family protein [Chthonomonas sp.]